MTQIGAIYVAVKADDTEFKKGMTALRKTAKQGGSEVSKALDSAITGKKASASISAIGTNLAQLAKTAKVPEKQFKVTSKAISDGLSDVARQVGMSEKQFRKLNERMLRQQTYKTAENSLRNLARQAGLSGKETTNLARQMGYSSREAKRMADSIHRVNRNSSMLSKTMSRLTGILGVYVGLAGARALGRLATDSLAAADAIAKTADSIGISTDALQEYQYIADRSGVSTQALNTGLTAFSKRLGEMRNDTGALKTILGKYNEELMNQLKNTDDVGDAMAIFLDHLKGVENQSDRAALASAAFGRTAGVAMTNMIDNIEDLRERYHRLGINIDESLLRKSEAAKDSLDDLSLVIRNSLTSAVVSLAPELGNAADTMARWVVNNKDFLTQDVPTHIKSIAEGVGLLVSALGKLGQMTAFAGEWWAEFFYGPADLQGRMKDVQKELNRLIDLRDRLLTTEMDTTHIDRRIHILTKQVEWMADEIAAAKTGVDDFGKGADGAARKVHDFGKKVHDLGTAAKTATAYFETLNQSWIDFMANVEQLQKEAHDSVVDLYEKRGTQHELMMQLIEEREREALQTAEDMERERVKLAKKINEDRTRREQGASKEWERVWTEATNRIDQVFVGLWDGTILGTSSMLDSLKQMFARTLAELAHMAVTRPIIIRAMTAIGGGLGIPGVAQAGQQMLGATGGGGGLLSTVLPGTASSSILGGGATAGMAYPGGMGAAPAGFGGGATLGSALGAGALGGLGYATIGKALGLPQSKWSGLTAGIGGAAGMWGGSALGATAGSIIPIVGTVLGALGGGLLGSLFGKPPLVEGPAQKAHLVAQWTGTGFAGEQVIKGSMLRGDEGYGSYKRVEDLTAAQQDLFGKIGTQLTTAMSGITRETGGTWEGMQFGSSIQSMLRGGGPADPGTALTEAEIAAEVSRFLGEATKAAVEELIDSDVVTDAMRDLRRAYGHIDWTAEYETVLSNVQFATNFRRALAVYSSGITEMQEAIGATATEGLKQLRAELEHFRETTEALGLGVADATKAQQDYLRQLAVGRETMTEMESAFYQAEVYWKEYENLLLDVGFKAAEAAQLAQEGWERAAHSIEAQLASLQASAQRRVQDALGEEVSIPTMLRSVFGKTTMRNPAAETAQASIAEGVDDFLMEYGFLGAGYDPDYKMGGRVGRFTSSLKEWISNTGADIFEIQSELERGLDHSGRFGKMLKGTYRAALDEVRALATQTQQLADVPSFIPKPWLEELSSLLQGGVTGEQLGEGLGLLNTLLEDGSIVVAEYNNALNLLLSTHADLAQAEQELAIAREASVHSIDQLLAELTYGSLAGPQSLEMFQGRFAELYPDAINLEGEAQQKAVSDLVSFVPEFARFQEAYGGYEDFRQDMVTLFRALREDVSGERDYHIHIELDGKEIAHIVAAKWREGETQVRTNYPGHYVPSSPELRYGGP